MKTITVTCKIDLPADATYPEALAWVKFELGERASLNPSELANHDLEAYGVEITW